jgi:hypothetical protein
MKKYLIILFAFALFVMTPQAFAQSPTVAKPTVTKTEKPKEKPKPKTNKDSWKHHKKKRESYDVRKYKTTPKPNARDFEVIFQCNVYGAILTIDDVEMGDANSTYILKEGSHVAVVEADGFDGVDSLITITESEDSHIYYFTLEEMSFEEGDSFDDWDASQDDEQNEEYGPELTDLSFQPQPSQQIVEPQQMPVEEMVPVESMDLHNETIMVKDTIPIVMVYVPGGTYTRYKIPDNIESVVKGNVRSGLPSPHKVTLSGYYIGAFEVTCELWYAVMADSTVEYGPQFPFDEANWEQCQEFIAKLNQLTGKNFRLPTDAEWEYAARGGAKSHDYVFSGSNDIDEVAWYSDNYDGVYHDVGTKEPNELGIYDMTGSVPEWCGDWWWYWPGVNENSAPLVNPRGEEYNGLHVIRGGGYAHPEDCCVFRLFNNSGAGSYGFRLAM